MASSFSRAQKPLRGRGSKKCPHHGDEVIYACERCDDLACVKCVINVHKSHTLAGLGEVVSDIKQNIQDFIDKAEQDVIPRITGKLKSLNGDLSETKQHCSKQINEIRRQNVRLKQELDDLTEKLVKSYQDLEQERMELQTENIQEMQSYLDEVNSRLQACRDTIMTGNDVLAYDNSKDISLTFTEVSTPPVTKNLIKFTPADVSLPCIEQIFGKLTITKSDDKLKQQLGKNQPTDQEHHPSARLSHQHAKCQPGGGPNTPLVKTPEQPNDSRQQPDTESTEQPNDHRHKPVAKTVEQLKDHRQRPVSRKQNETHQQSRTQPSITKDQPVSKKRDQPYSWLRDFKVVSEFSPIDKKAVSSLYATPENQVWLSSFRHDIILLTDNHGNVQHVLMESLHKKHFCLAPKNANIWYISYLGGVREMIKDRSLLRFETKKSPTCICVTRDEHIVLGYKCYLEKYTSSGQVIVKTPHGGWFSSPLLKNPVRITECPVTKNMTVIDEDNADCGGKDKPYVSILDKDLKPLYTYHGARSRFHPPQNIFHPYDLCYSAGGELIITERFSKAVFLVSGKGEYIRTLYTDRKSKPLAVCVQNDNTILVSFDDYSVKVLKNF